MPRDEAHRRYLIAIGVTTELTKSKPLIVESVDRMTKVFTGTFGYERVTSLNIDPETAAIRKKVRDFCLECGPEDIVALYYTGHSDKVNERHRLWTGDTTDSTSTLPTADLAEFMLYETPLRYALMILDTCFAGDGGAQAIRASVASMGAGSGKTLALLTAAYPREQIVAGQFAQLFERASGARAVAGHEPSYLALGAIAGLIDTDKKRPASQTISYSVLFARTDLLPFFPNPRFDPQLQGLDLFTQLQLEESARPADDDMRAHFLPRARGVDVATEAGWRFVGRQTALRDLVSWLRDTGDLSVRVVTGGPGSGKSAVIGRLAVLSDPGWRRSVPMAGLAPDTIPPEGSIADATLARGKTTAQVLAAVCAAAGVRAETPADLIRELRGKRFTVAIDAVDEALDPIGLVSAVLRPLVKDGPAEGLRLLLGTRPHLLAALGPVGTPVDLDDERYADPESIYEYVLKGLTTHSPESPYRSAPAELVAAVAKAVAEAAGHSFLVALIVSRTLASAVGLPDPTDPGWRAGLPASAADAMHQDLEVRLGADASRARELLRPLAFAAGAGFPWEDLWAPLASRLSGHDYTDEDLIWLRRHAGSYVVEALEAGRSVYRLYHAALAEYLRQGYGLGEERRVHRQFYDFLASRVPASRSGPDWGHAHPYILAHLATHASRAGTLDELLLNPRYLVNAGPAGLLAALADAASPEAASPDAASPDAASPDAASPDAELAGRAYQHAVHQFRGQPEDYRFSYLELASRIAGADELLRRLAEDAPDRRWSVPWTHWPPEYPHRILDAHLGPVAGVICAELGDGSTVVASVGTDATLRLWDAVTGESRGNYPVGEGPVGGGSAGGGPLVAIRAVRGPRNRILFALLSAAGVLHTWDPATATLLRSVQVVPLWRRLAGMGEAGLVLRSIGTSDGRQFAVTGGSGLGIRTFIWDVSSGRKVATLPVRPDAIELTELESGKVAILASMDEDAYQLYDLQDGHALLERMTYYAEPGGGPPLVGVQLGRAQARLWDVGTGESLGNWDRGTLAEVRLASQRMVTVPIPAIPGAAEPGAYPSSLQPLRAWADQQPGRTPGGRISPRVEARGRFLRVALRPDQETLTLAGHTANITGFDWTRLPDGRVIIVSASYDGTVRRWDVTVVPRSAGEQREPAVELRRVASLRMADGMPLGLTASDGVDVGLWDLRTGEPAGRLHGRAETAVLAAGAAAGDNPIAVTSAYSVLSGHSGWSAGVTCVEGTGGPLALTAGLDNRVNVWELRRGRRRARYRIVPVWRFLTGPSRGQAQAIRTVPLDTGRFLVLITTADGAVRSLLPRGFPWPPRRTGVVAGDVAGIVSLSGGQRVVVTGGSDGIMRIWTPEALMAQPAGAGPLCEIDIEVPVNDIAEAGDGTFVAATPNGLTAIKLAAASHPRWS